MAASNLGSRMIRPRKSVGSTGPVIDWVFWASGVMVGLLGAGFAIRMYYRPPKRIRLGHQQAVMAHFDQARLALPQEASMSFAGTPVERLTTTTVVLWNAGTEVLRGEDIVQVDPIRVAVADGVVLRHRIVGGTKKALGLNVDGTGARSELQVRYDYLNAGDGVVIEVTHDGTSVGVVGEAKGLKDGPEDRGALAPPRSPGRVWQRFRQRDPMLVVLVGFATVWVSADYRAGGLFESDASYILCGLITGYLAAVTERAFRKWRQRRVGPPTALRAVVDRKRP